MFNLKFKLGFLNRVKNFNTYRFIDLTFCLNNPVFYDPHIVNQGNQFKGFF
jgi:hypothetical protein